jgi:hypothetical protein
MIIKKHPNNTYYVMKQRRFIKVAEILSAFDNNEPIDIIESSTGNIITMKVINRLKRTTRAFKLRGPILSDKNYYPIRWTNGTNYVVNLGNGITYNPRTGKYYTSKTINYERINRSFDTLIETRAFKSTYFENLNFGDE